MIPVYGDEVPTTFWRKRWITGRVHTGATTTICLECVDELGVC